MKTVFHSVIAACVLAVHTSAVPAPPAVEPAERPNVLMVIADDLDTATFNRGVSLGLLPNLTALAMRGSVFANAFVTNAVCCPARVSLLTGQYSHNHGVRTIHPPVGGISVFDDRSTLAVWLKNSGYRTGHVGKYLNGYGSADANRDGLRDEHDIRYIPPGWDDWQSLFEPSSSWMYNYAINDNGAFTVYGADKSDYQTDVLADRAADFIVESAQLPSSPPFFLSVSPSVPHMEVAPDIKTATYPDAWRWTVRPAPRHAGTVNLPLDLSPSLNEVDVSDKPAWVQALPSLTASDREYLRVKAQSRLAALRAFDDLIGTVVEALQATGELDNTFVVVTSDNGYQLGEHRLTEKLTAYEESIRVPLIVAGPGVPAQRLRQMVTNTDIAPTIVDVAHVQAGLPFDGLSMRPVWTSPTIIWRRRFLIEHWQAGSAAVEQVPTYAAIRTSAAAKYVPAQLYVEYDDAHHSREFYDLATDPFQLDSRHADQSAMRAFQRSVHAAWLAMLKTCGRGTCQVFEFIDR